MYTISEPVQEREERWKEGGTEREETRKVNRLPHTHALLTCGEHEARLLRVPLGLLDGVAVQQQGTQRELTHVPHPHRCGHVVCGRGVRV